MRHQLRNDFLTNYFPKKSNFYGSPTIYKLGVEGYKQKIKKIPVETKKSEYAKIPNTSEFKFIPIVAG